MSTPSYDTKILKIRQLHFGLGRFHKAHQAYYNHLMLQQGLVTDWGTCSLSLRSPFAADQLKDQGYRYHVLSPEENGDSFQTTQVAAICETLFPTRGADRVRFNEIFESRELSVVTFTITEKGYVPDGPALTLLMQGLRRRHVTEAPPLTLVSCDNLTHNGDRLKALVMGLAKNDEAFFAWCTKNLSFPNSMVDRIVPTTTAEHHKLFRQLTGQDDAELVATEAYYQWVLQDQFKHPPPPWADVGVQLVTDVSVYENMKLRLLNGSHSLMAYLGQLRGHVYVHEAIKDNFVQERVQKFWQENEDALSLSKNEVRLYCEKLLKRFENSFLNHSLKQIAMDGSQKTVFRWIGPALTDLQTGRAAQERVEAVATWIFYLWHSARVNPNHLEGQDPLFNTLPIQHMADCKHPADLALALEEHLPDLATFLRFPQIKSRLAEALAGFENHF